MDGNYNFGDYYSFPNVESVSVRGSGKIEAKGNMMLEAIKYMAVSCSPAVTKTARQAHTEYDVGRSCARRGVPRTCALDGDPGNFKLS